MRVVCGLRVSKSLATLVLLAALHSLAARKSARWQCCSLCEYPAATCRVAAVILSDLSPNWASQIGTELNKYGTFKNEFSLQFRSEIRY